MAHLNKMAQPTIPTCFFFLLLTRGWVVAVCLTTSRIGHVPAIRHIAGIYKAAPTPLANPSPLPYSPSRRSLLRNIQPNGALHGRRRRHGCRHLRPPQLLSIAPLDACDRQLPIEPLRHSFGRLSCDSEHLRRLWRRRRRAVDHVRQG